MIEAERQCKGKMEAQIKEGAGVSNGPAQAGR